MIAQVIVATCAAAIILGAACMVEAVRLLTVIARGQEALLDLTEELARLEHLKNVPSRQMAERVMEAHGRNRDVNRHIQ